MVYIEWLMYQRINRRLEYAIMALRYMSKKTNQWVSVKKMVNELHCPFDPFSKVMQKLSDHHLIQSRKGVGGGYSFSGDLDKISLYQLMSIVLPSTEITECISGDCNLFNFCTIRSPMENLNDQLGHFYKGISLQKFFQSEKPKKNKKGDS